MKASVYHVRVRVMNAREEVCTFIVNECIFQIKTKLSHFPTLRRGRGTCQAKIRTINTSTRKM